MNYYNEHDPKAAAWLRELITQGLIPAGTVDERSITEIQPHELSEYTQCHFFAGIGGWSLALRLAGWPESRPVWTGSCPCQPFSQAGKGEGSSDGRHLWPVFRRLVAVQRPERVFGEQVAQAIGFNWLDGVSADLEADGYAVGAIVLGAHSVGAPHIRQRLYWVADANSGRLQQCDADLGAIPESGADGAHSRMGNAQLHGRLADPVGRSSGQSERESGLLQREGSNPHFWSDCDIIECRDGKSRRVESGTFPLAHGVPGRVGLLRGYGNAIVPQVAAEFIEAYQEVTA